MKAYVITIDSIEESRQAAERCIKSAAHHGVKVEKWKAITPADNPVKIFADKKLPTNAFDLDEKYSRHEPCMAAFLSHRSLWHECEKSNTPTLILEHDAYFMSSVNSEFFFDDIITLGSPSYGRFNTPNFLGVGPLTTKKYFPGAHAYYMTPKGAKDALLKSHTGAAPTDLFFHVDRFPNLKEVWPSPIECRDHFSTIQHQQGCLAKHNYGPGYSLV